MLKACPEIKPGKFRRVRPFHGMLLSEEDYLQDQTYFREKIKLHNRLHGYGIVCGLEIEKISDEELNCKPSLAYSIKLHAGMAIDWNGNEIIVCEAHHVDLRKSISAIVTGKSDNCNQPDLTLPLLVGIKYHERHAVPQAIFAPHCGSGDKLAELSRVCEEYHVNVFHADQMPWQPVAEPQSWDCPLRKEREHYIPLGYVTLENSSKQITNVNGHRSYVPAYPVSQRWSAPENQFISRTLIESMASAAGWINISYVIGMKKTEADEKLREHGFVPLFVDVQPRPELLRFLFKRAADYLPFAKGTDPKDEILLVHDSQEKVLFPIVAPEAEIKRLAGV